MLRIFPGQVSKLPMNEVKDFQTSGGSNIYFSILKSVNHRETTHNTETCLRNDRLQHVEAWPEANLHNILIYRFSQG